MAVKTHILDGEGGPNQAGVTSRHAVKTSIVERSAYELVETPDAVRELTARRQYRAYLVDVNGSDDMAVDGSSTSVEFSIDSEVDKVFWITSIRFIMEGESLELDTNDFRRFGTATSASTPLASGIDFIVQQGVIETSFFLEPVSTVGDFMLYADEYTNFINAVSAQSDFLMFQINFDIPVVIPPGSTDRVFLRVNDDLTAISTFKAVARGYQETVYKETVGVY